MKELGKKSTVNESDGQEYKKSRTNSVRPDHLDPCKDYGFHSNHNAKA